MDSLFLVAKWRRDPSSSNSSGETWLRPRQEDRVHLRTLGCAASQHWGWLGLTALHSGGERWYECACTSDPFFFFFLTVYSSSLLGLRILMLTQFINEASERIEETCLDQMRFFNWFAFCAILCKHCSLQVIFHIQFG